VFFVFWGQAKGIPHDSEKRKKRLVYVGAFDHDAERVVQEVIIENKLVLVAVAASVKGEV